MSKEAWLAEYERSEECTRMIDGKPLPPITAWEARVRAMEALGMDRSDAQGVIDAEDLAAEAASKSADCPPDESEKPDKWAAIEKAMREGKVISIEPLNQKNWR
jgi:hypothetical protein